MLQNKNCDKEKHVCPIKTYENFELAQCKTAYTKPLLQVIEIRLLRMVRASPWYVPTYVMSTYIDILRLILS